ncbi:hypothetical protein C8R46DRAFT_1119103 [Mycena filopes]|nr:hypothetical protein C8R46DRAFT_1119103 [Mycena filopes]
MATLTSCTSSATATTTSLLTTDVVTTTFTDSISTAPPSTTTITTSACALNLSDIACVSTATTITSTIAGSVTTIHVPVTSTVATVETSTLTLFATSCTTITSNSPSGPSDPSGPSSSSGAGSGPGVGSGNSGSMISLFTPPPSTVTTSSATTLANGQVSEVMLTFTSTPAISTVFVGPTGHVAQDNNGNSSSSHIGPIVGGIVGGFFALLGIALGIWYLMKRRRRWDDIFDKEDAAQTPRATKRFSLDAEVEPKPYQYGLVGHTPSPTLGISPPSSPPASSHNNLTPLRLPTTASTPGPSATTMSSRPSTAGSMRPLRDPPTPGHTHNHTTSSGSSTSVQHISPAMPVNQWGHHSPSPSADQAYFDRAGAGSPAGSLREYEMPPRRLQLANLGDGELMGASPPTPSALQRSSTELGPAMLDGKGRNVRLGSGGPGVLVHTDAGPANPPGFTP